MKKSLFSKTIITVSTLIILFFTGTGLTFAQDHKVELTPFGGYMLGGSVKFYEGKFKIQDAGCYGGMLAVQVRSGSFVEFSYTGMTTQGDWKPYSDYIFSVPEGTVDMAVNHFQIGSVNELPLDNEAIRPYGTVSLGTTWFNIQDDDADDEWLFSVAAGLGLKYFFNDKVGIRLQARMLIPLVYNGGGFYLGTGGSGMYVSSTAPIIQGDFTGGLIIALGSY
jgi:opacity protein-like surface antigen